MGLYDLPPSRRFAYDRDGSVWYYRQAGSAWTALSQAWIDELNDEDNTNLSWPTTQADPLEIVIIFPELREIDGLFCGSQIYASFSFISSFEWSADTTNGTDGTWSSPTSLSHHGTPYAQYRDDIETTVISGARAIRFKLPKDGLSYGVWKCVHIYGSVTSATEDRIYFLDPYFSDAVFTQPLDYPEIPRGTTSTRPLKLKNASPTLTASTVQITAEDLYLEAGDWYDFSLDGLTSWESTLLVGTFTPGEVKTIYMRQAIAEAATLGLQTGRLRVNVGSWA